MQDIPTDPVYRSPVPSLLGIRVYGGEILMISIAKANGIRFFGENVEKSILPIAPLKDIAEVAAYDQGVPRSEIFFARHGGRRKTRLFAVRITGYIDHRLSLSMRSGSLHRLHPFDSVYVRRELFDLSR